MWLGCRHACSARQFALEVATFVKKRVTGIDENGLGPWLSPLVATSLTLCCEPGAIAPLESLTWATELGIGDSKAVAKFGSLRTSESLALALHARSHATLTMDGLLEGWALSPEGRPFAALQQPCPSNSKAQCWSDSKLSLPLFGGSLDEGETMLRELEGRGFQIEGFATVICCVRRFNELRKRHQSKFTLDLRLFETLIERELTLHRSLDFVCGMVGGIRSYTKYFSPELLKDRLCAAVTEDRKACHYRFSGSQTFDVAFVVDADAHHLAVALASMVGKYIRELLVHRQNRFYQRLAAQAGAALVSASGYHDPVTKRFVKATKKLRLAAGIDDGCFLREG